MHPAFITSSATSISMASKAANALLCIWIGPLYCPSPLMALKSFSNTTTSNPFLFAAKAKTSPPIPPPATRILSFFSCGFVSVTPAVVAFTLVSFLKCPFCCFLKQALLCF
ncbi:hypothetical protein CDL12_02027 [Handroanthus impetiginosus]|uniref:Uncharacterized protein n=1 Tax=Handroanthus impetiginosus TaxID=429701 RepID=A0A2G9I641_9LAMI|nr:hypothetical protein CDL12_02027 [Handroanthus impetiginosus]